MRFEGGCVYIQAVERAEQKETIQSLESKETFLYAYCFRKSSRLF